MAILENNRTFWEMKTHFWKPKGQFQETKGHTWTLATPHHPLWSGHFCILNSFLGALFSHASDIPILKFPKISRAHGINSEYEVCTKCKDTLYNANFDFGLENFRTADSFIVLTKSFRTFFAAWGIDLNLYHLA